MIAAQRVLHVGADTPVHAVTPAPGSSTPPAMAVGTFADGVFLIPADAAGARRLVMAALQLLVRLEDVEQTAAPLPTPTCTECDRPVQDADDHGCMQCADHCKIAAYRLEHGADAL